MFIVRFFYFVLHYQIERFFIELENLSQFHNFLSVTVICLQISPNLINRSDKKRA